MPHDLSIVIVAYRVCDLLLDCLHSLYDGNGLRGIDAEVIVVDNASQDGTREMIAAEFSGVTWIGLPENRGFATANNIGLRQSTGKNLLLLNPDTIVPANTLAQCIQYLESQSADVAAMGCRVVGSDGIVQWECARRAVTPADEISRAFLLDRLFPRSERFNRERNPEWDRADERDVEALLGAFILMRRSAYEAIGGLDERFFLMYEDTDYCTRIRSAGYRIRYWPGAVITHLGGSSWRQERIATYANSHIAALQYMHKHFPADVNRVRLAHRYGLLLKMSLLRLSLALRRRDAAASERLKMAISAYGAVNNWQEAR